MPVIAVLRINAAGNRIIRKFLRQEVHYNLLEYILGYCICMYIRSIEL